MSQRHTISKPKIFAALHEETDKGWVWFPKATGFVSRMTVKVRCGTNSVYCEYRETDGNFAKIYDSSTHTEEIDHHLSDGVVMSDWYRKALGDLGTGPSNITLELEKPSVALWADLRAACQHPEPGARVATRVAIWGTWLAFAGLLPVVLEMEPIKSWLECHLQYPLLSLWAPASLAFAVLCWRASRGIKPR